ncbi:MAG: hypothetical protein Greene041662_827 [Candidatus Peregrinibacteria bacterium Greene0416_62]|nr:MAG: hypothetical protein Greene041662_827 [Candidatus Peregrinibacteria bacterium Greene0416_62]
MELIKEYRSLLTSLFSKGTREILQDETGNTLSPIHSMNALTEVRTPDQANMQRDTSHESTSVNDGITQLSQTVGSRGREIQLPASTWERVRPCTDFANAT